MAFSLADYSDITPLGKGGMATVYRAVQTSLGRQVVIKKLGGQEPPEPDVARRFENEARAAAALEHDNIIRIYDYGVDNGVFHIVMEYVDGCDLEGLLAEPEFPVDTGLMIVSQALRGLHFSHGRGIVHRDVKPANILVAATGRVKIADFGLALSDSQSARFTRTGAVVGTPHYMAPEQLDLEHVRDRRVDVWAAGVVLYRVIAGRLPFDGDSLPVIAYNIVHRKERDIALYGRGLPRDLVRAVDKCLEKDPAKRLPSLEPLIGSIDDMLYKKGVRDRAGAVAAVIARKSCKGREVVWDGTSATRITSPLRAAQPDARGKRSKNSVRPLLVAAAVLCAALALGGALYFGTTHNRAAREGSAEAPAVPHPATLPKPAPAPQAPESHTVKQPGKPPAPQRAVSHTPRAVPRATQEKPAAPAARETTAVAPANGPAPDTQQPTHPAAPQPQVASAAGTGGLCVLSFPRAAVSIDGRSVGSTPIETPLDIAEGKHTVSLEAAGYETKEIPVNIKKNKVEWVKARLEKK
ncbi:MAG TPA: protein kinase [Chitinivibrionales bacterium]|jgi:serine/threonine-protein kinase|nr:protein kinase [Chitinivibrionales bacterium]